MAHSHSHNHSVLRHPTRISPLGSGLGLRIGIAAAATALLWLVVLWAVN
jgi:hypothetical protein